jgi:hypothetical protein
MEPTGKAEVEIAAEHCEVVRLRSSQNSNKSLHLDANDD